MIKIETVQKNLTSSLNIEAQLGVCQEAMEECNLSHGEQAQFRLLKSHIRKKSWLKGRKALKTVLSNFQEEDDTTSLQFPHPRFSLTHSGLYAIAIGTLSSVQKGIGVDYEVERFVNPDAIRFFLNQTEQNWLKGRGMEHQENRLCWWTIKEALFKSDPNNKSKKLSDYTLADPSKMNGKACDGSSNMTFRYVCQPVEGGYLTVAICL